MSQEYATIHSYQNSLTGKTFYYATTRAGFEQRASLIEVISLLAEQGFQPTSHQFAGCWVWVREEATQ